MSIGPAAATRKYCGETGVMEQEAAYLQALGKVPATRSKAMRSPFLTPTGQPI